MGGSEIVDGLASMEFEELLEGFLQIGKLERLDRVIMDFGGIGVEIGGFADQAFLGQGIEINELLIDGVALIRLIGRIAIAQGV